MPVFKNGNLWVPESERLRQEEKERNNQKVTCNYKQDFTKAECPECKSKIIVHCPQCNTRVTGCGCTMKKRVESVKEELTDRLYQ